jgi:cytosine/adenosine deaminase-related metal-dependent hydrolase
MSDMFLKAPVVLTMCGEPLRNGCVRVRDGRVTEVVVGLSARPDEEVLDLHDVVLMPGLINAHAHLDYTCLRGKIERQDSFAGWIRRIVQLKQNLSEVDYIQSIQEGFDLLIQGGCTTVFNIQSALDVFEKIPSTPIRTWWFMELMDIRGSVGVNKLEELFECFKKAHSSELECFGLSPHAPYTVSRGLYELVSEFCGERGIHWTTHLAESGDEWRMFFENQGTLWDLMDSFDYVPSDKKTPLKRFDGIDTSSCLAVHMNELNESDFEWLRQHSMVIVYCPKSHAYFQHKAFELEKLISLGCRVCLGTDSLASNDSLDLREEIREAKIHHPRVSCEDWLRMVTTVPADYIGMKDQLGVIRKGAWADLVGFACSNFESPYEQVITSKGNASLVMVRGRVIHEH